VEDQGAGGVVLHRPGQPAQTADRFFEQRCHAGSIPCRRREATFAARVLFRKTPPVSGARTSRAICTGWW
jgi:hypothetical protein